MKKTAMAVVLAGFVSQAVGQVQAEDAAKAAAAKAEAETVKAEAELRRAQACWIEAASAIAPRQAEAWRIAEEARQTALENHRTAVHLYYEKRELYQLFRDGQTARRRPPPPVCQPAQAARPTAPCAPLEAFDVHHLPWPAALQDPAFAATRAAVDRLFLERGLRDGGADSQFSRRARELTDQMGETLHRRIWQTPPAEYVAAKEFLNRVQRAAQSRPVADPVAAVR